MTSSKYFSKLELKCRCCDDADMDEMVLKKLDALREVVRRPVHLNSAKRCKAHNERVGGKPNSAHLLGRAVDISAPTGHEKYEILKAAFRVGFNRIGVANGFIHVDDDLTLPNPVVWTY